jgi:death-on-curing protein
VSKGEPRWVPRLVVEAIHLDQVREHGGLLGIRDENVLESALARARQRWTYEPDAGLPRLAADYAFGIARNHPFQDGNKRVAFLAAVTFLGLNGLDFVGTEEDVVEAMLALAAGSLDERELTDWISSRVETKR